MIDISVIMPVFNEEKYLHAAIDSILSQTFDNFEFIIIDDASTDNSLQIIKSYTDKRIILICNEYNVGNYPSRNRGLELAVGKYICVMDADDIAYPQKFEFQYKYLETHPDIWGIGTNFIFSNPQMKRHLSLSYKQLMIHLLQDNTFLHSSLMIRADVMRMHGGYDEKYIYSSDYDLMSRLALSGKVENLPDILMMCRWHASQISQLHRDEQKTYAYDIRRKYQIEFINRYRDANQQTPDEWTVGIPEIGRIIALYTYANYTGDVIYEKQADELLEQLLGNDIEIVPYLGQESSFCSLGCGLIYILRNGFAEGEENEILMELDTRLSALSINWNKEQKESLYGWIHYLTLRIDVSEESSVTLVNKQNLIQLLDRLEEVGMIDECLLKDIRIIDGLGLFPERTKRLLGTKEIVSTNYNDIEKQLDDVVTFVIPVRIDSSERQENLDVVLDQLSKRTHTKIIILEADSGPLYKMPKNYPNVTYLFVKDDNPIFYRTKYLNELLRQADTSIVGIWDTDVIVPDNQIDRSIDDIREGRAVMSFPYDGCFNFCSLEDSFVFRNKRSIDLLKEKEHLNYVYHSVGGAFLVHRGIYMKAGGENEHFYAWGMEDMERVKRMEILGFSVSRTSGCLYHLFHFRKENSRFYNQIQEMESRREFLKVCSMYKKQLEQYICTWKNIVRKYESRIYLPLNMNSMRLPSDTPIRSLFMGNNFCLIEKYNMAFVAISKNAITHLKNVLLSSVYGFYPNNKTGHNVVGYNDASPFLCPVSNMQEKEKEFGKMVKFAVWRDPVERLVSCYKHFCVERMDHYYFRFLALYEDDSFDRFMEFVRFELGKKNPLYQDEHIRRQSDYYRSEDVDYIVPIHKLNQFLEEHGVPLLKKSANETSVKFQLKDSDYIAEIKELYRSDYEIVTNY
ncbi:glycosyltransferase [uncultured Parabacteroides sp.]|uniref:glycosyltransferase n=1 Tax=uncultured Parabacteroides sp. TaxID=512312 RepID=UPI002597A9B8|nr:glycosyltransferase [uncultured Parabacteroides sp.]